MQQHFDERQQDKDAYYKLQQIRAQQKGKNSGQR
jgi:hypothetical protein